MRGAKKPQKYFASWIALVPFLLIGCKPETAYKKEPPPPLAKAIAKGAYKYDPSVDILFVIDNSGSMGIHQSNLSSNVGLFTKSLAQNSALDFRIAVTTTTDDKYSVQSPGTGGTFFRVPGAPAVISNRTSKGLQFLKENLMVGVQGDGAEKVCDVLGLALSQKLLKTSNVGWRRPGGHLAIMIITDTDDQSRNFTPKSCYDMLLKEVGGVPGKLMVFAAFIESPLRTQKYSCTGEGEGTKFLEAFLTLTGGYPNSYSLCDPNFGQKLAKVGSEIRSKVGRFIYPTVRPDLTTLSVKLGGIELPEDTDYGWQWNEQTKAIVLGTKIDWSKLPSGSTPEVFFMESPDPYN